MRSRAFPQVAQQLGAHDPELESELVAHLVHGRERLLPLLLRGLVEQVKAIKSPAEIAYLRNAGAITTLGMRAAIEAAAAGKTENDVAAAAYHALFGGGSDYMAIPAIVTSGAR